VVLCRQPAALPFHPRQALAGWDCELLQQAWTAAASGQTAAASAEAAAASAEAEASRTRPAGSSVVGEEGDLLWQGEAAHRRKGAGPSADWRLDDRSQAGLACCQ